MRARRPPEPRRARALLGLALGAALLAGYAPAAHPPLPFGAGETLVYRVSAGRLGRVGTGTLRVSDAGAVRDRPALLLRMDVRTRIGLVTATDSSRSWLDPERMAALRFQRDAVTPVGRDRQRVEIFPDQRRWEAADGRGGATPCDAPLDELSFIYFVRTLPLRDGDAYRVERHFEAARNPVAVRVVGRERLSVPAGEFATVAVEMRVKDARNYRGEGVIRLWLSDDPARVPVRIESSVPVVGRMVLSLEAQTRAPGA